MLVDDGVLRRDDGAGRRPATCPTIAIPPTIHALLTARLERLDRDERAVIERASVVGARVLVGRGGRALRPRSARASTRACSRWCARS